MEHHRIGHTRPRHTRQAAWTLQTKIKRDLVRSGAEGNVGKLLVKVETFPTCQIETFVGNDRPVTFDKGILETACVMLSMASKIFSLDDLRPKDQTNRSGRVRSKIFRLRRPFFDPSIPFGKIRVKARVVSLRPEDNDKRSESGELPTENRLSRLGRTDEENVATLSGNPSTLRVPFRPGDDRRGCEVRQRRRVRSERSKP